MGYEKREEGFGAMRDIWERLPRAKIQHLPDLFLLHTVVTMCSGIMGCEGKIALAFISEFFEYFW